LARICTGRAIWSSVFSKNQAAPLGDKRAANDLRQLKAVRDLLRAMSPVRSFVTAETVMQGERWRLVPAQYPYRDDLPDEANQSASGVARDDDGRENTLRANFDLR
jgi:hypothetical protein